jgi:hypothetical protein
MTEINTLISLNARGSQDTYMLTADASKLYNPRQFLDVTDMTPGTEALLSGVLGQQFVVDYCNLPLKQSR